MEKEESNQAPALPLVNIIVPDFLLAHVDFFISLLVR
jgi:hypothetical protein